MSNIIHRKIRAASLALGLWLLALYTPALPAAAADGMPLADMLNPAVAAAVIPLPAATALPAAATERATLSAPMQPAALVPSTPPALPAVYATFTGVPAPSLPGESGSHVRQSQQALIGLGYLAGEADGFYSPATEAAIHAFQQARGLHVNGRADADTLLLLFTDPFAPTGQTIKPHWYGGGSQLIPMGAVFEVKDIATGAKFTCVRMHGTSHLDAEPLTAQDTEIMFNVYSRDWKWDRRAILLSYRGMVIAASMNGKPHTYDAVPNNNMKGHFCIHFFGSRIDGNQRIDDRHQACIEQAAKEKW